VFIATSLGDILIQLDTVNAPRTAANFLRYVDDGFYDGADGNGKTTFHRVIKEFMIQGGGMTTDGSEKLTHSPIAIESDNGLSNTRGTVAMARTSEPNSATSQFYINHVDNTFLDYVDTRNPGYTVFGKVLEGMDTVDAIALVHTDSNDEPVEPVIIESMSRRAN
jgi:peptidyl-prolyl cis-trans isomerase A (cyclophilin A)